MTNKTEMPESQQEGGCDYMSYEDACKLFNKYISMEMRDPYGLNDDAKAMLTFVRETIHKAKLIETLEGMKIPVAEVYDKGIDAYNAAIDDIIKKLRGGR